jgi:hypothetical protein
MLIKKFENFVHKSRPEITIEDSYPDKTFSASEVEDILDSEGEGYFLEYDGNFIGFAKDSNDLYNWIENKLGPWTIDNSDEWSEYIVHDPNGETFSW